LLFDRGTPIRLNSGLRTLRIILSGAIRIALKGHGFSRAGMLGRHSALAAEAKTRDSGLRTPDSGLATNL